MAKIVAETMNNYLMGERLIQCKLPPLLAESGRMYVLSAFVLHRVAAYMHVYMHTIQLYSSLNSEGGVE